MNHQTKSFGDVLGLVYVVCLPVAFIFQRWLEAAGYSDAKGFLYSSYCTIAWAFAFALPVAVAIAAFRRWHGRAAR